MKTSRFACAAMAAVMTIGMAGGVTASAELAAAPEDQSLVYAGETDGKEYDEADWEAYKRNYWDSWEHDDPDEEYTGEVGLSITDEGLIYRVDVREECAYVADYIGRGEDLVIPEKLEGLPVTGLLDIGRWDLEGYGFHRMKNVKTVVFKADIKRLGTSFTECPKLEKVVLPEHLEEFADIKEATCCAFCDCPKLKEVVIPDSLDLLVNACFRNTPWLEAREKKEGLVIIGSTLLSGRQAKGKVVIPNNVKYISGEAFCDNTGMTELVIPASVKVSFGAFWNTTGLKKLTYKNGCKGIDEFVSRSCTPNLETVIIPPSFTKYGTKCAVGFDEYNGDWKEYINPKTTYYYYKGTKADKVLNDKTVKGYTKLKKSVLPGKTKSIKVTAKKGASKVTWQTVSTATGYQVQVSAVKTFKKGVKTKYIKNKKTKTYTFKNLKSSRKYYVRMRTYKTIGGKKYYGNFTKTRFVTVK